MTLYPRPAPGAAREYHFPAVERSTLANGIRVAVATMPRLPIVTVLALFDSGACHDPVGAEGTTLLTAAAIGEGTVRLEGARLTERFEGLGTGFVSGGDWDSMIAHLSVTPARLEQAVGLLSEVLAEPAFRERDVERLKGERLAELLQQQVEPRGLADDEFAKALYVSASRFGVPDGGNESSVKRLNADALRRWHQMHAVPAALTLIFVGDVTMERADALTEATLGTWRGTAAMQGTMNDETRQVGRRVCVVHKPEAPQSELRIGHRGVARRHVDYFPVVLMNALLGGLFSSRINLNLRERHAFTYGARSAFDWRRHAGPFVVSTAVKTEVTDSATREILREIDLMRLEPVSADELSLASDYLVGVFPLRFESTNAVANAIAVATAFGLEDDYYTTYRGRIREVTAADVLRAAVTHLHPEELLVLAVGDAAAIREPLERLAIGPVEVHAATGEVRA